MTSKESAESMTEYPKPTQSLVNSIVEHVEHVEEKMYEYVEDLSTQVKNMDVLTELKKQIQDLSQKYDPDWLAGVRVTLNFRLPIKSIMKMIVFNILQYRNHDNNYDDSFVGFNAQGDLPIYIEFKETTFSLAHQYDQKINELDYPPEESFYSMTNIYHDFMDNVYDEDLDVFETDLESFLNKIKKQNFSQEQFTTVTNLERKCKDAISNRVEQLKTRIELFICRVNEIKAVFESVQEEYDTALKKYRALVNLSHREYRDMNFSYKQPNVTNIWLQAINNIINVDQIEITKKFGNFDIETNDYKVHLAEFIGYLYWEASIHEDNGSTQMGNALCFLDYFKSKHVEIDIKDEPIIYNIREAFESCCILAKHLLEIQQQYLTNNDKNGGFTTKKVKNLIMNEIDQKYCPELKQLLSKNLVIIPLGWYNKKTGAGHAICILWNPTGYSYLINTGSGVQLQGKVARKFKLDIDKLVAIYRLHLKQKTYRDGIHPDEDEDEDGDEDNSYYGSDAAIYYKIVLSTILEQDQEVKTYSLKKEDIDESSFLKKEQNWMEFKIDINNYTRVVKNILTNWQNISVCLITINTDNTVKLSNFNSQTETIAINGQMYPTTKLLDLLSDNVQKESSQLTVKLFQSDDESKSEQDYPTQIAGSCAFFSYMTAINVYFNACGKSLLYPNYKAGIERYFLRKIDLNKFDMRYDTYRSLRDTVTNKEIKAVLNTISVNKANIDYDDIIIEDPYPYLLSIPNIDNYTLVDLYRASTSRCRDYKQYLSIYQTISHTLIKHVTGLNVIANIKNQIEHIIRNMIDYQVYTPTNLNIRIGNLEYPSRNGYPYLLILPLMMYIYFREDIEQYAESNEIISYIHVLPYLTIDHLTQTIEHKDKITDNDTETMIITILNKTKSYVRNRFEYYEKNKEQVNFPIDNSNKFFDKRLYYEENELKFQNIYGFYKGLGAPVMPQLEHKHYFFILAGIYCRNWRYTASLGDIWVTFYDFFNEHKLKFYTEEYLWEKNFAITNIFTQITYTNTDVKKTLESLSFFTNNIHDVVVSQTVDTTNFKFLKESPRQVAKSYIRTLIETGNFLQSLIDQFLISNPKSVVNALNKIEILVWLNMWELVPDSFRKSIIDYCKSITDRGSNYDQSLYPLIILYCIDEQNHSIHKYAIIEKLSTIQLQEHHHILLNTYLLQRNEDILSFDSKSGDDVEIHDKRFQLNIPDLPDVRAKFTKTWLLLQGIYPSRFVSNNEHTEFLDEYGLTYHGIKLDKDIHTRPRIKIKYITFDNKQYEIIQQPDLAISQWGNIYKSKRFPAILVRPISDSEKNEKAYIIIYPLDLVDLELNNKTHLANTGNFFAQLYTAFWGSKIKDEEIGLHLKKINQYSFKHPKLVALRTDSVYVSYPIVNDINILINMLYIYMAYGHSDCVYILFNMLYGTAEGQMFLYTDITTKHCRFNSPYHVYYCNRLNIEPTWILNRKPILDSILETETFGSRYNRTSGYHFLGDLSDQTDIEQAKQFVNATFYEPRQDQYEFCMNVLEEIKKQKEQKIQKIPVLELLMGKGKTSMITPLLVFHWLITEKHQNVCIVLPNFLINQTRDEILNLYAITFGLFNIVSFTLTNIADLIKYRKYFRNVSNKRVIIIDIALIKEIELRANMKLDDITNVICKEYKDILQDSCVIFDEIHLQYLPSKSELNIPILDDKDSIYLDQMSNICFEPDKKLFNDHKITLFSFMYDIILSVKEESRVFLNANESIEYIQNFIETTYYPQDPSNPNDMIHIAQWNYYKRMPSQTIPQSIKKNIWKLESIMNAIALVFTLRYNKNYGFGREFPDNLKMVNNHKKIIPFYSTNNPVDGSEFSGAALSLVMLCVGYIQRHYFSNDDIRLMLSPGKKNNSYTQIIKDLSDCSGTDIKQALLESLVTKQPYANPTLLQEYLKINIKQLIETHPRKASITSVHIVSTQWWKHSNRISYTGTANMVYPGWNESDDDQPIYSNSIWLLKPILDTEKERQTQAIFDEAKVFEDTENQKLDFLLNHLEQSKSIYDAFIDVGAITQDESDDNIILILMNSLVKINEQIKDEKDKFKYIIYFKSGRPYYKSIEAKGIEMFLEGSDYKSLNARAFMFYAPQYCTGTDIKHQPSDCRGLVSINYDTNLSSALQGIFRLRQLRGSQKKNKDDPDPNQVVDFVTFNINIKERSQQKDSITNEDKIKILKLYLRNKLALDLNNENIHLSSHLIRYYADINAESDNELYCKLERETFKKQITDRLLAESVEKYELVILVVNTELDKYIITNYDPEKQTISINSNEFSMGRFFELLEPMVNDDAFNVFVHTYMKSEDMKHEDVKEKAYKYKYNILDPLFNFEWEDETPFTYDTLKQKSNEIYIDMYMQRYYSQQNLCDEFKYNKIFDLCCEHLNSMKSIVFDQTLVSVSTQVSVSEQISQDEHLAISDNIAKRLRSDNMTDKLTLQDTVFIIDSYYIPSDDKSNHFESILTDDDFIRITQNAYEAVQYAYRRDTSLLSPYVTDTLNGAFITDEYILILTKLEAWIRINQRNEYILSKINEFKDAFFYLKNGNSDKTKDEIVKELNAFLKQNKLVKNQYEKVLQKVYQTSDTSLYLYNFFIRFTNNKYLILSPNELFVIFNSVIPLDAALKDEYFQRHKIAYIGSCSQDFYYNFTNDEHLLDKLFVMWMNSFDSITDDLYYLDRKHQIQTNTNKSHFLDFFSKLYNIGHIVGYNRYSEAISLEQLEKMRTLDKILTSTIYQGYTTNEEKKESKERTQFGGYKYYLTQI